MFLRFFDLRLIESVDEDHMDMKGWIYHQKPWPQGKNRVWTVECNPKGKGGSFSPPGEKKATVGLCK